jgi:DNA helicase-2/ATP-dependent DNA helicase PcrA
MRRTRCRGPETFESGWNPRDKQIARIYAYYLDTLRESNALDFDDLLLKTLDLVEKAESVRERYARQFRYVMVDEYQDTNRPQYLLVRRLAEHHRNICVVGDPDQSIYKWRGADLRNILDFEHDFPETTTVRLERNYRSTQVILDAASAVIRQNRNRKEKRLWTDKEGGAKVLYFRGQDELEEADYITRTARRALSETVMR